MKKYSRKWRKFQKEKEIRRANAEVGEPYSKAKTKKHICLHYVGMPSGIIAGYCASLLEPISETECRCSVCHKVFPIEKMAQMEELVDYLFRKGCITNSKVVAELSQGIEPVYYRKLSATETEIVETITDQVIMPRHFGVLGLF